MEANVLPLEVVLDAVATLLNMKPGSGKQVRASLQSAGAEPDTLCSMCLKLGLRPTTVGGKNLHKSSMILAILKHQFEMHQYKLQLPMNSRVDILTPKRSQRVEEQNRVLQLSHRTIGVQTDTPGLSEAMESLHLDGCLSADACTQTAVYLRAESLQISTRNTQFISPTPSPSQSPTPAKKRGNTTPEPSQSPPTKVRKPNTPGEETKEETVQQPKTRRRKSLGHRNKAKSRSAHPSEMERKGTPHSSQLKEKGVLAVRALEGFILDMPWSNAVDSNGEVTRLGKKDLALYVAAESIAEGCELETSFNLATRLFDVPADTIKKCWYAFQKSDYTFITSFRGKHPKLQWALEECDVKVFYSSAIHLFIFCSSAIHPLSSSMHPPLNDRVRTRGVFQERAMAYIEETCRLKGDDKLTIQSFARWLNTVLLPECYTRDDGLFFLLNLLQDSACSQPNFSTGGLHSTSHVFSTWALSEHCRDLQVRDPRSGDWTTVIQNVHNVQLKNSFRYRTFPDTFTVLLIRGDQGAFALQPALLHPHHLPGRLRISDFVKCIDTGNWLRLAGQHSESLVLIVCVKTSQIVMNSLLSQSHALCFCRHGSNS
jgi:hypothetical protein